jgi:hypothetical protein
VAEVAGQFFQVRGMRRVPEADEFLVRQIAQADGGPDGEGMLRVADKGQRGQRLPADDVQVESGLVSRINGQAEIGFEIVHGFTHTGGRVITDRNPRGRMSGLELAEAGGQLMEVDY